MFTVTTWSKSRLLLCVRSRAGNVLKGRAHQRTDVVVQVLMSFLRHTTRGQDLWAGCKLQLGVGVQHLDALLRILH